MLLAARANGVSVRFLAACARSWGAVRARQSSAASLSCIIVLAHTVKLKCPLTSTESPDGHATVQNLPQLAYEGIEHGGRPGQCSVDCGLICDLLWCVGRSCALA